MTGAGRRDNYGPEKLVVSRTALRLQNTRSLRAIFSCHLTAVAEVDEVGSGVIEKAVRTSLDFEVLNQPEGVALENSHMAIEAGYIQFVEVAAEEQRVLSVLESGETVDHLPAGQIHNLQRIIGNGGHKKGASFPDPHPCDR